MKTTKSMALIGVGSTDLFGDGSVVIMDNRQEMLWIDATPDEDYALRILRAYLLSATEVRTISNPPALGMSMNKIQDARADILRRAIERLVTPNDQAEP